MKEFENLKYLFLKVKNKSESRQPVSLFDKEYSNENIEISCEEGEYLKLLDFLNSKENLYVGRLRIVNSASVFRDSFIDGFDIVESEEDGSLIMKKMYPLAFYNVHQLVNHQIDVINWDGINIMVDEGYVETSVVSINLSKNKSRINFTMDPEQGVIFIFELRDSIKKLKEKKSISILIKNHSDEEKQAQIFGNEIMPSGEGVEIIFLGSCLEGIIKSNELGRILMFDSLKFLTDNKENFDKKISISSNNEEGFSPILYRGEQDQMTDIIDINNIKIWSDQPIKLTIAPKSKINMIFNVAVDFGEQTDRLLKHN
jgi:hypothetical protein